MNSEQQHWNIELLLQDHERHSEIVGCLRAGGREWIKANKALIRKLATELSLQSSIERAIRCDLGRVEFASPSDAPVQYASGSSQCLVDLTIVVACHNYARYLGDCLQSIKDSTALPVRVIVIDDSSDDDPSAVAEKFNVEFYRVELRNFWKVCKFGFSLVRTKYVAFMDADDTFDPGYIAEAIGILERDRNAAIAFPRLLTFGDPRAPKHGAGTQDAPKRITARDVEYRNWCPMSTVFRSEILRQSVAFQSDIVNGCILVDWRLVRNVLRAGPWHGIRTELCLNYRIHPTNGSKQVKPYAIDADLSHEVVTIIIALSGRWDAWGHLRTWLERQIWPREQTRLLILNSTHQSLTVKDLGLQDWHGAGIQIERVNVGRPGLADEERVDAADVCQQVEAAVAGLYNKAVQLAGSEFILFIEDDVIPQRLDAIAKLMSHIMPDVGCVAGIYEHRYHKGYAVSFLLPYRGLPSLRKLTGPDVEQIGGSGFGCLLTRKSVMSQLGFAGDSRVRPHYDCEASARVADIGLKWIMDRTVYCEHMLKPMKQTTTSKAPMIGNQ